MLETENFEENRKDNQPKSFIVAGLAILIIGIASGAAYRYNEMTKTQTGTGLEAVEGTVEQYESGSTGSPTSSSLSEVEGKIHGKDVEVKSSPLPNPSVKPPSPSPSPARGEGKKVVDICTVAKKERDEKYETTDGEYTNATIAAKQTYDTEQLDLQTKLNALARARNDAINQYLTAVAIATSKYNSSIEANAYETYQQEQSAALTIYTDTVAKISVEEVPAVAAKKDSETKYSSALTAAAGKRDQDKAAADSEYNRVTADKC